MVLVSSPALDEAGEVMMLRGDLRYVGGTLRLAGRYWRMVLSRCPFSPGPAI